MLLIILSNFLTARLGSLLSTKFSIVGSLFALILKLEKIRAESRSVCFGLKTLRCLQKSPINLSEILI